MTDVNMRWVGTDATGAAAASAKKNIDSVGKAAGSAAGAMEKMAPAGKNAGSALASMDKAASGVLKGITGLGAAIGAGALVGLAAQAVGAVGEMARASDASRRLEISFKNLAKEAGASGSEIMTRLQQASGGAISQYDLMLSANKAMMLGVASSADDMGKLMEIAMTRGQAMGLSTTQAFNDLVTGLGRGSALILDNLGIMVDADATNKAYAASVGKTVEQLTEQEKKQALVNATLKEATGSATVVASSSERLAAAWADMKVSMGDMFGPALAAGIEALAAGARGLVEVKDVVSEALTTTTGEQVRALSTQTQQARAYFNDYSQLSTGFTSAIIEQWRAAEEAARQAGSVYTASAADFGLTEEEFAGVAAMRDMLNAQAQLNTLAGTEVDIRREIAGMLRERASAATDAANAQSAANLAAQYEGVSLVQQRFAIVKEAADSAGLSTQQLGVLSAQAATQFAVLTSNGYTAAQAMDIIAVNADRSAEAMAAATEAAAASRAAVEGLHGAQLTAATSANGLGIELHFVGDAGFGAKAGIDAASLSAVTAQGSFWGLVTAAQEASAAMRQAQFDAAGASLKAAYVGAAGTLGAGNMYGQYQDAEAALAAYTQQLDASGVSTEEATFLLEEFKASLTDSIDVQLQTRRASEVARTAAHSAATGLGLVTSKGGGAASKLDDLAGKAGDLSGKLQGLIDQIPGLKGTSPVTEEQINDAKLGIPQNFADDYLRRLTDEVMNGVDWEGVDMADAAQRAGIDPNLPVQAQLKLFAKAWEDSSLFSNPANLDLINMDAVKAGLTQANNAAQGKANIDALFGIGDDATVAAVAGLGLSIQNGLAQFLSENGMPDAGAKLAEAIGAGVSDSGIPLDGGLNTWIGSDGATEAINSVATVLGLKLSEKTVIRPSLELPSIPSSVGAPAAAPVPAFASGTTWFGGGWARVGEAGPEMVRLASGPVHNARRTREFAPATVVVNAVINNKLDEAQFQRMLRDAVRKAQVRT